MLGGFGKALKAASGATLLSKGANKLGPKKTAALMTPLGGLSMMAGGVGLGSGPSGALTEQRLRERRDARRQARKPRRVTK